MHQPDWLHFIRRKLPSANSVLIRSSRPVLIDTGFGSDLPETERLLRAAGVPPERLQLIINTHYHCDHVGGNSGLQRRYELPVAAHEHDAAIINRRDPDACRAAWLDQPVEPYHVDRPLSDGDEIDAGEVVLQVVHTPGHTLGHIALYELTHGIVITGDLVQADDTAWINIFNEGGPDALERTLASLDRLARLPLRRAYSGHTPVVHNPLAAIDDARRRYEKWQAEPQKLAWHACKRIFAYALIVYDGMPAAEIAPYLVRCPWFCDYGRHYFGLEPEAFVQPLLEEMVRARAAAWHDGRLVALAPHTPPPAHWPSGPTRPADWPPAPQ